MKGFKNARVYIEGKGIVKTNVAIENGIIVKIGEVEIDNPFNIKGVVFPGFIDEHIHGAMGADAMDGNLNSIKSIACAIASEGTTCFLTTTMTQSVKNITNALSAINMYINAKETDGAEVLGVHLEGPFISKKFVGAQPIEYVQAPEISVFDKYNEASGGNIKIVSLAPEEMGALELIKHISNKGIVASVGHSSATSSDIEKAIKAGLKSVTHTYNAQTPLHHREIGVVGSSLLFDELNSEIICDTIHVSVPAIKLLIKNKPHDKLTLITDAMRAKHMPEGVSELGGQQVFVKNGEARLKDGTLAGSVLKMNDAIKNLVEKCGVSITDAVDFATVSPAKNLGVFDKMGSIAVGKKANFAVLDDCFNVELTVRDQNIIYKK